MQEGGIHYSMVIANFVSVLIGGILDNYESISGVDRLLEKLFAIKKIARIPSGSNYAIDRIKLTGENSVIIPEINRSVYISEPERGSCFASKNNT